MHVSSPRAVAHFCGLLFFLLYATPVPLWAQTSPSADRSLLEQQARMVQQARQQTTQQALASGGAPLEGPVDPDAYRVGPGDVFTISIGTALPTDLSVAVSADGLLVVPSVGSFDVAGRTLSEVRALALAGIRTSFRNVNAEVALERPRQFYVHVAGTVTQPGRHVVAPVSRVEDALAAAMGETSPVLLIQELRENATFTGEKPYLPALRSVEVRHSDGTVEIVDLWRYYTSGNLRYNPFVRDGDAIRVPAFRDDLSAITVEGEVANAGSYDYRDGDTVLDLLTIAVGTDNFSELGEVRLVRRGTNQGITIDPVALMSDPVNNPALRPGDHLLVMPQDLSAGIASIAGYVEYPGSYPIRTDETTLRELVEMAGGLRPDALLRGAYLERRGISRTATYEPDQPTPYRAPPPSSDLNPQTVELLFEREVVDLARNSDLNFSGRQFYGRELLQPQRVSIDVSAALTGTTEPVLLQDGDRLVVPRDPNAVLVVGLVNRPGYVPYQPGFKAEDYINQAGGKGSAASGVYVRDATTGRISLATDAALSSGDYVFVDRVGIGDTPEAQSLLVQERGLELQERNLGLQLSNRYFQLVATAIGSAATIITILLTRQ